jgi:hypothetical protein
MGRHRKRDPVAPGRADGARGIDQLTTAIPSEIPLLHHHLQVHLLVERFGLSETRADLVARLAWGAPT